MTPLEQAELPWTQHRPTAGREHDAILKDIVLPSLRAEPEHRRSDERVDVRSPRYEGTTVSVVRRVIGTGERDAQVRMNLHAHPHVLAAMGLPDDDDAASCAVMADVLERIMTSPHVRPEPFVQSDIDRLVLAGLRLIETSADPDGDRSAVQCAANPLGLGGVHCGIDDGLRFDRSPDLIRPGPIEMCLIDVRPSALSPRKLVVNIGSAISSVRCRPMDPLQRLRLEAAHPWDPTTIHADGAMHGHQA